MALYSHYKSKNVKLIISNNTYEYTQISNEMMSEMHVRNNAIRIDMEAEIEKISQQINAISLIIN